VSYLVGAYAFALLALGGYVVYLVRQSRLASAKLLEQDRER
jgi:hypothetical protein